MDVLRSKILFHDKLSETNDSIDKMTMDRLLWLNEQIESKYFMESAYHFEEMKKLKDK